jgi:hypothetical protein
LRSNLDVLENAYTRIEKAGSTQSPVIDLGDERIVDFSQTDLAVEDLPRHDEPEIQIDDTEDFSRE